MIPSHIKRYSAQPTARNWARVLAAAVAFDPHTVHCHVGGLVSVGNLVFRVVVGRQGAIRFRRFNRARRTWNTGTSSLAHFTRYAAQNPNG